MKPKILTLGSIFHLQVHVIYTSTNGSEARPMNVIDGTSLAHCNWMKRVSPAPDPETWNLLAYQHNQNIFFITVKPIEPHQELMVRADALT